jgi:hypothetical protein
LKLKRALQSSIFSETLVFDGEIYRTPVLKDAIKLILFTTKELEGVTKKERKKIIPSSHPVPFTVPMSNSFESNLEELSGLAESQEIRLLLATSKGTAIHAGNSRITNPQ